MHLVRSALWLLLYDATLLLFSESTTHAKVSRYLPVMELATVLALLWFHEFTEFAFRKQSLYLPSDARSSGRRGRDSIKHGLTRTIRNEAGLDRATPQQPPCHQNPVKQGFIQTLVYHRYLINSHAQLYPF